MAVIPSQSDIILSSLFEREPALLTPQTENGLDNNKQIAVVSIWEHIADTLDEIAANTRNYGVENIVGHEIEDQSEQTDRPPIILARTALPSNSDKHSSASASNLILDDHEAQSIPTPLVEVSVPKQESLRELLERSTSSTTIQSDNHSTKLEHIIEVAVDSAHKKKDKAKKEKKSTGKQHDTPLRDARGRFIANYAINEAKPVSNVPVPTLSQEMAERRRTETNNLREEEHRNSILSDAIKQGFSSVKGFAQNSFETVSNNRKLQDTLGYALAGPFYAAAKEISGILPASFKKSITEKITGRRDTVTRDEHGRFISSRNIHNIDNTRNREHIIDATSSASNISNNSINTSNSDVEHTRENDLILARTIENRNNNNDNNTLLNQQNNRLLDLQRQRNIFSDTDSERREEQQLEVQENTLALQESEARKDVKRHKQLISAIRANHRGITDCLLDRFSLGGESLGFGRDNVFNRRTAGRGRFSRVGRLAGRTSGGLLSGGISTLGELAGGGARLAGNALKAVPIAGQLLALGMAGYDAVSGWNNKELHKEIFNLQDGQEATTGQKASTAIASVLDMGGLTSGLLSMFGAEVNESDIARGLYNLGNSINDFFSDNKTQIETQQDFSRQSNNNSNNNEKQNIISPSSVLESRTINNNTQNNSLFPKEEFIYSSANNLEKYSKNTFQDHDITTLLDKNLSNNALASHAVFGQNDMSNVNTSMYSLLIHDQDQKKRHIENLNNAIENLTEVIQKQVRLLEDEATERALSKSFGLSLTGEKLPVNLYTNNKTAQNLAIATNTANAHSHSNTNNNGLLADQRQILFGSTSDIPASKQKITPAYRYNANAKVGDTIAQFESGAKGIATIGYDRTGGTSYGKWQLSSKQGSMQEWLNDLSKQGGEASAIAQRIRSAGALNTGGKGGAAVQQYLREVQKNPELIEETQRQSLLKHNYYPAMKRLKNESLKEMVNNDKSLQEMMFSTSVQHGGSGAAQIFNKVYREGMNREDFVRAVYNERGKHFSSSTSAVQEGVKKRFAEEQALILGMSHGITHDSRQMLNTHSNVPYNQITSNTLNDSMSAMIASSTQKAIDHNVKYKMGAKNSKSGQIDCSGWVQELNNNYMKSMNQAMGKEVFSKQSIQAFNRGANNEGAAGIIRAVSEQTGELRTNSQLTPEQAKEGMLIGVAKSGDNRVSGRFKGIGHIVQTYRDAETGELMVSESSSNGRKQGKDGVQTMRYSDWYERETRRGKSLYGTDIMKMADESAIDSISVAHNSSPSTYEQENITKRQHNINNNQTNPGGISNASSAILANTFQPQTMSSAMSPFSIAHIREDNRVMPQSVIPTIAYSDKYNSKQNQSNIVKNNNILQDSNLVQKEIFAQNPEQITASNLLNHVFNKIDSGQSLLHGDTSQITNVSKYIMQPTSGLLDVFHSFPSIISESAFKYGENSNLYNNPGGISNASSAILANTFQPQTMSSAMSPFSIAHIREDNRVMPQSVAEIAPPQDYGVQQQPTNLSSIENLLQQILTAINAGNQKMTLSAQDNGNSVPNIPLDFDDLAAINLASDVT